MKLSFVIIEYHSVEDILTSSSFIHENMKKMVYHFEIIVSSNSMYDAKKRKQLLTEYPQFKWKFNEKNGGFAYAMNKGLKIADGEVLIILNPDVKLKLGFGNMIEFFTVHKEIGLIAPMIRNEAGDIQDSYRHFITPLRFILRHLGRFVRKKMSQVYDQPLKVDWVCGAFIDRKSVV